MEISICGFSLDVSHIAEVFRFSGDAAEVGGRENRLIADVDLGLSLRLKV